MGWVKQERELMGVGRREMDEHGRSRTGTDATGAEPETTMKNRTSDTSQPIGPSHSGPAGKSNESVPVRDRPCESVAPAPSSVLVANAALSLLNVCTHLLDRQIDAQARSFLEEGDSPSICTANARAGEVARE